MSKRHTLRPGDWESIFGRLQELVLANSGEDEFEEIFKVLVAKIYDEVDASPDRFRKKGNPEETGSAIDELIAEAADRWRGILRGKPESKLRPEHLEICVKEIEDLQVSDSSLEVLDNLFEHIVSRSAKGSKGQYFTPRHVVDCCVKVVDPSPEDTVIDPACGSGGFLIHTLQHISNRYSDLDTVEYARDHLWGCDYDDRAVQVAKALMVIAGADQSNIFRINSLIKSNGEPSLFEDDSGPRIKVEDIARSKFKNFEGFDIVMTNPPFAGEIKEKKVMNSYELGRERDRIERDILFLERCVDIVKPRGKICIVVPQNKVVSKRFSKMRKWTIKNVDVKMVLELGKNTFRPHTQQKASVIIGKKRDKPKNIGSVLDDEIFFSISESSGKNSKGEIISKNSASKGDPSWVRADHDMSEVVDEFRSFIKQKNKDW